MVTKKKKGAKCTKIETKCTESCNYRFSLKHRIKRNLESKKQSRKGEIPINVKIETQRTEFCNYRFPLNELIQSEWKSQKGKLKKHFIRNLTKLQKNPMYKIMQIIGVLFGFFRAVLFLVTLFHH